MSGFEKQSGLEFIVGQPQKEGEPIFAEPWEAQAFALTVAMHEKGMFEWKDWAQTLGSVIARDQNDRPYYELWLEALETIIAEKSMLGSKEVMERKAAWQEAVESTPHGQPIVLRDGSDKPQNSSY